MSLSTTKKGSSRRLKQKNSASTEESSESTFLINVKSSKQGKQIQNTPGYKSIQQAANDDSPSSASSRNARLLLHIPLLNRKREENSIFETRNIDNLLNSDVGDLGTMKLDTLNERKVQQLRDSNLSNILSSSGQEDEYRGEIIVQDSNKRKSIITVAAQQTSVVNKNSHSHEAQFVQSEHTQGKHFIKKYLSMNEVAHVCEESKVNIAMDDVNEVLNNGEGHQHRVDKSSLRELKSFQLKKQLISKQNMASQGNRNEKNGRMTLRDYMYQTQISARKALNFVKESQEEGQLHASPKPSKGHKIQKRQSLTSAEYKNSRYGINSGEMADILRADICSDIREVISSLVMIEKELTGPSQTRFDPAQQELLLLYNTRRTIKEIIGAQVNQIHQSLRAQRKESVSTNQELIFRHI